MNKGVLSKAARYGLCSAVALLVDVGIMTALIEYGKIPYLWAAAVGFVAGCTIAYLASVRYVFENQNEQAATVTVLMFVMVGIGGLLLNQLILYVGVDIFALHYLFAKAVSAVSVFWFNFLLRGLYVFKDPDLCKIP